MAEGPETLLMGAGHMHKGAGKEVLYLESPRSLIDL